MIKSSLIYIEKDESYLMLHRVSKQNDPNKDKWIGVGGKFENGETPEECAAREMKEETGLVAKRLEYRGIVHFESDKWESEEMHLFTCREFEGKQTPCDEGKLEWVKKADVPSLNLWEGDRVFLKKLANEEPFFELKLIYEGEKLIKSE